MLFINELLGMPLHPGQIKFIEDTNFFKTKINVLVPSNRWGKTSLIACKHIWKHFYKFGVPSGNRSAWAKASYRTANVAPMSSLIEPVFNYIDEIMTSRYPIQLPDGRIVTNKCKIEWFYLKEQTRESPVHKQFFAFNSYIEHRTLGATAADSLEGKPFGYISYDEAGRSKHLEDEVNGTLLARLFDWGGELDLISTPDQTSPSILFHYELFQKGMLHDYAKTKTYAMEGALTDNIFFPKEQIQEQYELYEDNPLKEQVLKGKFVFGGDNLFFPEDISRAKDASLNAGKRAIPGHKYIIATDTAMASDEMVHSVLDYTDLKVERVGGQLRMTGRLELARQTASPGNKKTPEQHMNDFLDLLYVYKDGNNIHHILETFNGESARFYQDLPYEIQAITKCYGTWQPERRMRNSALKQRQKTKSIKKAEILLALQKALTTGVLKFFEIDPNVNAKGANLSQQLTIYKEKDDNLPTDRLISLAMGCWLAIERAQMSDYIPIINM